MGVLEGGAVLHGPGVEDRDVCKGAFLDDSTVFELHLLCRQGGHLADCLFLGHIALVPGELPQDLGKGTVRDRRRIRIVHTDDVGHDRAIRVGDGPGPDPVADRLVIDAVNKKDLALFFHNQVEGGVVHVCSPRLCDVTEPHVFVASVLVELEPAQHEGSIKHIVGPPVVFPGRPLGKCGLHLLDHGLACLGIAELLQQLGHPTRVQSGRKDREQARECADPGQHVVAYLDPSSHGLFDSLVGAKVGRHGLQLVLHREALPQHLRQEERELCLQLCRIDEFARLEAAEMVGEV